MPSENQIEQEVQRIYRGRGRQKSERVSIFYGIVYNRGIKRTVKQFDKLEFGGEINELYQTMIFYTADRLAEVDNKNYIQLRNNVLV